MSQHSTLTPSQQTRSSNSIARAGSWLVVLFSALSFSVIGQETEVQPDTEKESFTEWKPLLSSGSLCGWKVPDFAGHGEVYMEKNTLILEMGNCMTGATYTNTPPFTINYEISLKAQRVSGSDFFCALTVPVKDSHCSLIVGGWGGGLVGISSLDGADASENETTSFRRFESGKWYDIRMRVESNRIQAWIDGDSVVDVDATNRKITTRIEVDPSKPIGVASWCTKAAIKDLKIRGLKKE